MKRTVACVILFTALIAAPAAHAVPVGALDPTFSGDGIVQLASGSVARLVQVDQQSRVIIAGLDGSMNAWVVRRYKANGSIDATWKTYRLLPGYGRITGLALWGTKTIVSTYGVNTSNGGRLIRLNANGTLDTTFGTKGVVADTPSCDRCGFIDMAVADDGSIWGLGPTGGTGEGGVGGGIDIFSPTGKYLASNWFPTADYVGGATLAVTISHDYAYVVGEESGPDPDYTFHAAVGRFFLDGTLDTSYGHNGFAWIVNGADVDNRLDDQTVTDVAVRPSTGQITVIGGDCVRGAGYCSPFIRQLTNAGFLETGFRATTNFGNGQGTATAVTLKSGGVVIAGQAACQGGTVACFGVERVTSTGALDTTFAGTGYVHTLKAPAAPSSVRVFNTKIVVAGGQYVARYQG
jgi:uncharacterized delta-60 repeat protein